MINSEFSTNFGSKKLKNFHPEIQLANKIFRFQPYSDIGQFIKAKQFGMPLFEFKKKSKKSWINNAVHTHLK